MMPFAAREAVADVSLNVCVKLSDSCLNSSQVTRLFTGQRHDFDTCRQYSLPVCSRGDAGSKHISGASVMQAKGYIVADMLDAYRTVVLRIAITPDRK